MEGWRWLGEVFRRSASSQHRARSSIRRPSARTKKSFLLPYTLVSSVPTGARTSSFCPFLSFLWQPPTLPSPWWGGSNTLLISLPIFRVSSFQSILYTVTDVSILKYSFTLCQLSLENNRTSPGLPILPGENNKSFTGHYGYSSVWPSKMYPLLLFNGILPARYKNLASG